MNRILGITLKILRSGQLSALVAMAALGLLFTASGAKAGGCAPLSHKAGAAPLIPFVSPQADGKSLDHQEDEDGDRPTIVGLWHLIYTAKSAPPPPAFPPTPFQFLESLKTWHADGTEFENAFLPPAGGNICLRSLEGLGEGPRQTTPYRCDVRHGRQSPRIRGRAPRRRYKHLHSRRNRSGRAQRQNLQRFLRFQTLPTDCLRRQRWHLHLHRNATSRGHGNNARYPYHRRLTDPQPDKMHAARPWQWGSHLDPLCTCFTALESCSKFRLSPD